MAASKTQGTKWTPEEDAILRRVYPVEGVEGAMRLIPQRTRIAIFSRVKSLSIKLDPKTLGVRRTRHLRDMHQEGRLTAPGQGGPELPPEYIQAADIFQVGFRVARDLGVIHEFA